MAEQDYNSSYRDFSWPRPARFNFARDVVDKWAEQDPEKLALFWLDDQGTEERRTFADTSAASSRVANLLQGAGVKPGDYIVMILGRQIAWWEVFTAALRMGAVISPGTAQLSAQDIAYRINAAQATCVVTDSINAAKVDQAAAQCPSLAVRVVVDGARDDWIDYGQAVPAQSAECETVDSAATDEAMCYFTSGTSGTTGYPKMCLHAHSYGLAHQTTGSTGWISHPRICTGTALTRAGPKRPGAVISAPGTRARPCLFITPRALARGVPSNCWKNIQSPPFVAPPPSTACSCWRI
jgi:acyl-coenzyme A synthetase/AMP-(fatty) acid ligase